MAEKKRTTKTHRQRAEEKLAVTDRLITKGDAKVKKLEKELQSAKDEVADLKSRRAYLAEDPALAKDDESDAGEPDSEPDAGDEDAPVDDTAADET